MVRSPSARPDMPVAGPVTEHGASARVRVAVAVLAGLVTGVFVALLGPWQLAPLISWDAAALVYLGWIWTTIWRLDPERTARLAVTEDPSRAASDALLLLASVASLVAVGFVIVRASHAGGAAELLQVGLGIASVVVSWAVVHTVFTLRYARLYYTGPDGGVDFNAEERPRYSDFAYLAFTIGMTFQVSDTDLQTTEIRANALRHALLSYLFGTIIVATTINLVAGLSR